MTATTSHDFTELDAPVEETLNGVVETVAGPFAVGVDGVVVGRVDDTLTEVATAGPGVAANALTDAAVAADGERVWFAGSSGSLGAYDVPTARKHDFSAPDERTSTWEALAVTGAGEGQRLLVANGSGEVLAAAVDADGCPQFASTVEPGGGASITAIAFGGDRAYAVDTSGTVFARSPDEADGPDGSPDDWRRIGIDGAGVDFHDVAADGEHLFVAGDDGLVFRYDRGCANWTPVRVGDADVYGVDVGDDAAVAVGDEGLFARRSGDSNWRRLETPVEVELTAVTRGDRTYAVGEEGVVLAGDDG